MSLNDKKNALFGKSEGTTRPSSSMAPTDAIKPKQTLPQSSYSYNNTDGSFSKSATSVSFLSQDQILKKTEEARLLTEKALKYLQTSMFNWSPDYLGAAPCYEKVANIYKGLGELDKARDMYVQAASCHEKSDCPSAAALALVKACEIAKIQNKPDYSVQFLTQIADIYATLGELDKCAEYKYKAAVEMAPVDKAKAASLYEQAIEMYYPKDTTVEALASINIRVLEVLRSYFSFLIKFKKYNSAIKLANHRLLPIYEANEYDSSLFKLLAGLTVLMLANGEVEKADKSFVEEHFSYKGYITSKEAEVAENFIMAFRTGDHDKLQKTKASQEFTYLDNDIQAVAKNLSLGDEMDSYALKTANKFNLPAVSTFAESATSYEATHSIYKDTDVELSDSGKPLASTNILPTQHNPYDDEHDDEDDAADAIKAYYTQMAENSEGGEGLDAVNDALRKELESLQIGDDDDDAHCYDEMLEYSHDSARKLEKDVSEPASVSAASKATPSQALPCPTYEDDDDVDIS